MCTTFKFDKLVHLKKLVNKEVSFNIVNVNNWKDEVTS